FFTGFGQTVQHSQSTQFPVYNGGVVHNPDDDDQITYEKPTSNELKISSNNGALNVSLSSEYKMVSSIESQELLCMASLVTSEDILEDAKSTDSHVDIVLVLDVSGSMTGDKINLLKESLRFIVSVLSPKDRLSLVTFNTSATHITPLLLVNDGNKEKFNQKIQALVASGGTDIGN
ncbi:36_t:CDS:1, partial [Ambispora leptoticha]